MEGRTGGGEQELEGAVCGSEIDFDLCTVWEQHTDDILMTYICMSVGGPVLSCLPHARIISMIRVNAPKIFTRTVHRLA